MIVSAGGVISTDQPESNYVHTGFTRKDETGTTIIVTCTVPYHAHFDAEGEWLTCDQANKFWGSRMGRVIKHPGAGVDTSGQPLNLPR